MEIKTNTMTQGEVLSSFAPIFAFIQICEDRQKRKDEIMSINDVNIMMPFVTKAQKAVDKISCYALNNINSKEKGKIEIMNLIKHNFVLLNHHISFDTFKGYDSTIDMLNNSIISVLYQINNTYDCLSTLEESLYTPVPNVEKNSTTDEKKSESITALEQRIKELEAENEQLRKHLAQWQKNEDEEETTKLKVEINRLNNDLKAFRTQDGKNRMTASQAAIFIQTACHHLGGLPNDKKTLSPILQWGWGFTEHTSRRALGGEAQPIVAEKTAQLFDNISPKMARLIREFPKTFDKLRKEKLKANNDKKLNDIKEKPR
jgi:hypothetical protein